MSRRARQGSSHPRGMMPRSARIAREVSRSMYPEASMDRTMIWSHRGREGTRKPPRADREPDPCGRGPRSRGVPGDSRQAGARSTLAVPSRLASRDAAGSLQPTVFILRGVPFPAPSAHRETAGCRGTRHHLPGRLPPECHDRCHDGGPRTRRRCRRGRRWRR